MTRGRLFIAKTMRPDITKSISDRIYHGETYPPSDEDEQVSAYPGVSLKGCSKDGKDGKDGSDGKESCDEIKLFQLDELAEFDAVNLSELFKPQNLDLGPGPVITISTRALSAGGE
jgi:hypothetical protein